MNATVAETMSVKLDWAPKPPIAGGTVFACLLVLIASTGCTREQNDATPLPTRQTTIDPVKSKLDAAQQEAERRRTEAERAGQ